MTQPLLFRLAEPVSVRACEDTDPECLHCGGHCTRDAEVVLQRIDMEDAEGTLFCMPCAGDALESGCFKTVEEDSQSYDHMHPGADCRYLGNDLWDCGVTDNA